MEDNSSTNELDLSKFYEKTCLICFRTDKSTKELFNLLQADDEQITFLEKLQSFSQENLWVNECTVLCEACLKDLDNAFQFRARLATSQNFWKNASVSCKQSDGVADETLKDTSNKQLIYYTTCKHCDALFTNNDSFLAHKCFVHNNSKQTAILCDLCGKKFKNITAKNRHKAKVHCQQTIYPCELCTKEFKQKFHLKEDLTSHTGERRYSCSICNKVFQRISSQRRHMKSHERCPGEKAKQTPFLCTICGKTFPYSNGVQRHLRIHSGEKNYECNICRRKFAQSTHLQVHLRTHTGEKPYMCNFCGESFALNAALQKHIVNSHSVR